MSRFEGCTLAIIAGGRGTRMGGVVKARLRGPDGRTLLQRTMDVVGSLVDDVLVVADDVSSFPGMRVVSDVLPGRGAPGGVHAACRAARTDWVLALASDLPFVSPDVLQQLWRRRSSVDAVIASLSSGKLEPLHAFYRTRCADAFEPMLRSGEPGFAELLPHVRAEVVGADELRRVDPQLRSFENINTPDQLKPARVTMPGIARRTVRRVGGTRTEPVDEVAVEEPLEIRIDGETVAVTMRTPGDDAQLALGFLYSEGIIGSLEDVGSVAHCGKPESAGNVIDVRSAPGVVLTASRTLESRRWNVTNSACGVCGRQSIRDLMERCERLPLREHISADFIRSCMEQLNRSQPNFSHTGGLHAAAAFAPEGRLLACNEDVGRHNAVDKVVGRLLHQKAIGSPVLLAVSGRASFEIVQKAVAARVPVVASVSAASSLAIDLAESAGLTLVSFARGASFNVCSHADRITDQPPLSAQTI